MLVINQLYVSYGYIEALKGISIEVNQGEIVTLIGSNGAGKSTLLKAISSLLQVKSGSISFRGEDITHAKPTKVVSLGLTHVPEGRRVFKDMSVEENLLLGAYLRKDKDVQIDLESVYQRFPILKQRKNQPSANLSGGEQQMLAIGRALMHGRMYCCLMSQVWVWLLCLLRRFFRLSSRSTRKVRQFCWLSRMPRWLCQLLIVVMSLRRGKLF